MQDSTVIHRLVVYAEEPSADIEYNRLAGCNLSVQQLVDIENIKNKWSHVLNDAPGNTDRAIHGIDTGDTPPIRSQPYLISPHKLEGVKKEVESLLKLGIIEPSSSPWSSPVVPVVKPDQSIRLCIDFRKLNSVTVPDPYYMPTVDELIGKVGEEKFLTKLDLAKGFYQVPLHNGDKPKTAFVTPWGKFQFCKMPFGLRNAPSSFQRLMDSVLSGLESFAVPYIDDILIYSEDWVSHMKHVEGVMSRLSDAKLTAKPAKCEWGQEHVQYLGHVVGAGCVKIPEARASSIKNFVRPVSKSQLKSFLGLTGYYRKFVKGYASIAKPLHLATHKSCPSQVIWTQECQDSFGKLCSLLSDASFLTIPSETDKLLVQTDASADGLGACLSVIRNGEELPAAFYSRKLTDTESRYAATELECLAVVEACRQFEAHLDGKPFLLQTDHKALESMHTSKLYNKRLARWALKLQGFLFSVVYRPGSANGNADGLSRQAWHSRKTGASAQIEDDGKVSVKTDLKTIVKL